MDILDKIEKEENIREAVYDGNLGAVEMINFYQCSCLRDTYRMEKAEKHGIPMPLCFRMS